MVNPRNLTQRQLDDVPVVAPSGEEFTITYQRIFRDLDVKLAPWCPNLDKAFANSTRGKVLGVEFDTSNLSWRMPIDKRADYMNDILSLCSFYKLIGPRDMSVNSWQIELCLRAFRRTLHEQMFSLSDDGGVSSIPLSYEARKYLLVWWAFLKENINVYPIG